MVTRDQLVAAFGASGRVRPPDGRHPRRAGGAGPLPPALLEGLAAEHLAAHGGDPEESLAALDLDRSIRESLAAAAGPEVEATLAQVGSRIRLERRRRRCRERRHGRVRPDPRPPAGTSDSQPAGRPGTRHRRPLHAAEKIGEGGMGEVWVAKQTEPVKRKVALKLIKPGMDSRAVLHRFEQERQALALMDHPNIAKVLDGGLTPDGQPFFVMELVNGLPLTKFCDEAKLTPAERLELFVPICQAVQHAHQKGIVHRDLKPSNILVTMIDGKPVPKVIDFGVAKATAGKLTDESLSTQFGAVVGTLEYMSPEQAGFSGEDIDTRADIYSLGVILYELLTGLRPIDATRLRKAALDGDDPHHPRGGAAEADRRGSRPTSRCRRWRRCGRPSRGS